MKLTIIGLLVFFATSAFTQSPEYPTTKLDFNMEFDTLRQVGYSYDFGSHNVSEYGNDISNGSLVCPKAKVNIVSHCQYETYFEDEIVTKIRLTTDDKEASLELKELAALICPELNMLENTKGAQHYEAKVRLNEKFCIVSYTEDKRSKNAILEIRLSDEVLN